MICLDFKYSVREQCPKGDAVPVPLLEDLHIHLLLVLPGQLGPGHDLAPALLDPGAGDLVGHGLDHQQLQVELLLPLGLFGDLANFAQQGLHDEAAEAFVVVEGVLGRQENVLVQQLQHRQRKLLVLILGDGGGVQDPNIRVQQLLALLGPVLHRGLQLLAHLPELEQLLVEGHHELPLDHHVDGGAVGEDLRQLAQHGPVSLEAAANEAVQLLLIELGCGSGEGRVGDDQLTGLQSVFHCRDDMVVVVVFLVVALHWTRLESDRLASLLHQNPTEQLEVLLLEFFDLTGEVPLLDVLGNDHKHLADNTDRLVQLFIGSVSTGAPVDLAGDVGAPLDHALDQQLLLGEEQVKLLGPGAEYLAHGDQLGLDLLLEQLAASLVVHLPVLGLVEEALQHVALLHYGRIAEAGLLVELDGLPEVDELVLFELFLHLVYLRVPEPDVGQYHVDHLRHYVVPQDILLVVEEPQQDISFLLLIERQDLVHLPDSSLNHLRLHGLDDAPQDGLVPVGLHQLLVASVEQGDLANPVLLLEVQDSGGQAGELGVLLQEQDQGPQLLTLVVLVGQWLHSRRQIVHGVAHLGPQREAHVALVSDVLVQVEVVLDRRQLRVDLDKAAEVVLHQVLVAILPEVVGYGLGDGHLLGFWQVLVVLLDQDGRIKLGRLNVDHEDLVLDPALRDAADGRLHEESHVLSEGNLLPFLLVEPFQIPDVQGVDEGVEEVLFLAGDDLQVQELQFAQLC